MINAVICAYKSGDVIGLALRQLIDAPMVTRILVADGPHSFRSSGYFAEKPGVGQEIKSLRSKKIVYEYSTDCKNRSQKCNRMFHHITPDCQWALVVDSDEVYHEHDLKRLAAFLATAKYDRYSIKTVDLFPDFFHEFRIPDAKPRLYRWFPGAKCPDTKRGHMWIEHPKQRVLRGKIPHDMASMPPEICRLYHLNALRPESGRVTIEGRGWVAWRGGKMCWRSKIYPVDPRSLPKSIRDLKRKTL